MSGARRRSVRATTHFSFRQKTPIAKAAMRFDPNSLRAPSLAPTGGLSNVDDIRNDRPTNFFRWALKLSRIRLRI
jgi:hypothetical protein